MSVPFETASLCSDTPFLGNHILQLCTSFCELCWVSFMVSWKAFGTVSLSFMWGIQISLGGATWKVYRVKSDQYKKYHIVVTKKFVCFECFVNGSVIKMDNLNHSCVTVQVICVECHLLNSWDLFQELSRANKLLVISLLWPNS